MEEEHKKENAKKRRDSMKKLKDNEIILDNVDYYSPDKALEYVK